MKLLLFMQKSKVLKKILLFLPFFLIFQMQAYFCPLHNHFAFTHALQSIDCKSHRLYPVAKPDNQVCMVVVPAGHDEQAQCLIAATYRVLEETGPDHDKIFKVGIFLDKELIASGEGSSKQEAQTEAAEAALKIKTWKGPKIEIIKRQQGDPIQ